MTEKLRVVDFDETYSDAWVILSDLPINGSVKVAVVLQNPNGIIVYRHRSWIDVDKILGAIGLDYVLMRRQVFDVQ